MKIKCALLAATISVASAIAANSEDAPSGNATAREMAAVKYLLGNWSCAHTVGGFSGTYRTTYSAALGGRWLRQVWDFPAHNAGGSTEAAVTAETLMGYDEGRQAWVRFFANSIGQHFEIRLADTPSGWSYKYISFFPRKRAETPEPDAIFTKKSDTEYTVDGPTYPQNGAVVTEHHICHKL